MPDSNLNNLERDSDQHFADDVRTIHYILVYGGKSLLAPELNAKLRMFISNLEEQGLEMENEFTTVHRRKLNISTSNMSLVTLRDLYEDMMFLKVHIPDDVIQHFAKVYQIDFECENYNHTPQQPSWFACMDNELTSSDSDSELYQRAPESVSGFRPSTITTCERIMIISKLLSSARFGVKPNDYGVEDMIAQGILLAAYPYHDGPCEWTTVGPLNDRQLLAKYWANIGCYWKTQPLNLINKYYGPQVAFYFAWLQFYSRMLLPVGILGFISFLYGLCTMYPSVQSNEVCNSDIVLCPPCENVGLCRYLYLKDSCTFTILSHLFDNPTTNLLTIVTSCWATTFIQLWERQRETLKLQWNLSLTDSDTTMRPEFMKRAVMKRPSALSETEEPYMPKHLQLVSFLATSLVCFSILIISLAPLITAITYRLSVRNYIFNIDDPSWRRSARLIVSTTGSLFIVFTIEVFSLFYNKIALWLTEIENPRTQAEFDNSFVYKKFAIAFFNNNASFVYLSFIKGRFFRYPGQEAMWKYFGGIQGDVCDPAGCLIDLGIQFFVIICVKSVVRKVIGEKICLAIKYFSTLITGKKETDEPPEWEKQYYMLPTDQEYLTNKFLEMVIQYGLLIFYAASFPLVYVIVFFNNKYEIRFNAYKLVWDHRRPAPKKVAGIGAWRQILRFITFISFTVQALIVAFTSNVVPREMYRYRVDRNLRGFINSTLSVFSTKDYAFRMYASMDRKFANTSYCYYPGYRYPPNHPHKYQVTEEYVLQILVKFIVVFIFEHLMSVLAAFVISAIPTVPYYVKERLNIQNENLKESRRKILNETYYEKRTTLPTERKRKLIIPVPRKHTNVVISDM